MQGIGMRDEGGGVRSSDYTAKPPIPSVAYSAQSLHCDWTVDCEVTDNCWQSGDRAANGSVVTILLSSHSVVTVSR